MGGKQSKGDGTAGGAASSSSAAAASQAPLQINSVQLNVYQPAQSASPVGGIYHSGIVLFDTEYMFAQGPSSVSGIAEHRPRILPDSQWQLKEAVRLGETSKSRQEIRELIAQLKNSGEWAGNSYHLTKKKSASKHTPCAHSCDCCTLFSSPLAICSALVMTISTHIHLKYYTRSALYGELILDERNLSLTLNHSSLPFSSCIHSLSLCFASSSR